MEAYDILVLMEIPTVWLWRDLASQGSWPCSRLENASDYFLRLSALWVWYREGEADARAGEQPVILSVPDTYSAVHATACGWTTAHLVHISIFNNSLEFARETLTRINESRRVTPTYAARPSHYASFSVIGHRLRLDLRRLSHNAQSRRLP